MVFLHSAYTTTSNDLSATVSVNQDNIKLYNLNIENTFGSFLRVRFLFSTTSKLSSLLVVFPLGHTGAGCACQAIALSTQASKGHQGFYGLKVRPSEIGMRRTTLMNGD